ncbi:MAG: Crp/Fnr family transcriptional regulator [Candidatus Bipolaricaulota bacterium]|nr:Crp/Fnr family transcriptional regulator [Candidatus Bipolaricaulota bacterium]MDW8031195.1 Crp/Fnr family transcriptional regulator [Candidatus Bipolaricaulota bacterium]
MAKLSCVPCQPPCPLGDLPPHEAQALNGLVRSVSFLPGQTIFEQGEPHSGCYLLCEGVAMLFHRTLEGRRIVVGVVGPGDIVGVGGFLGQERHELRACALTDVQAQHFSKAACERVVKEPSVLTGQLLLVVARQVRWLRRHERLVAAHAGVRERLAALLVELRERFGQKLSPKGVRIELPLSCELLGQMIDAHRSTVNVELVKLERRGLIERVSRQIAILDEAKLRDLAQSIF